MKRTLLINALIFSLTTLEAGWAFAMPRPGLGPRQRKSTATRKVRREQLRDPGICLGMMRRVLGAEGNIKQQEWASFALLIGSPSVLITTRTRSGSAPHVLARSVQAPG